MGLRFLKTGLLSNSFNIAEAEEQNFLENENEILENVAACLSNPISASITIVCQCGEGVSRYGMIAGIQNTVNRLNGATRLTFRMV